MGKCSDATTTEHLDLDPPEEEEFTLQKKAWNNVKKISGELFSSPTVSAAHTDYPHVFAVDTIQTRG